MEKHVYAAPASTYMNNAEKLKFGTEDVFAGDIVVLKCKTHKMVRKKEMHRVVQVSDGIQVMCGDWEICKKWWCKNVGKLGTILDSKNPDYIALKKRYDADLKGWKRKHAGKTAENCPHFHKLWPPKPPKGYKW